MSPPSSSSFFAASYLLLRDTNQSLSNINELLSQDFMSRHVYFRMFYEREFGIFSFLFVHLFQGKASLGEQSSTIRWRLEKEWYNQL